MSPGGARTGSSSVTGLSCSTSRSSAGQNASKTFLFHNDHRGQIRERDVALVLELLSEVPGLLETVGRDPVNDQVPRFGGVEEALDEGAACLVGFPSEK